MISLLGAGQILLLMQSTTYEDPLTDLHWFGSIIVNGSSLATAVLLIGRSRGIIRGASIISALCFFAVAVSILAEISSG